jgi:tRNA-(ms[2]io[6]A)-hydroxylase
MSRLAREELRHFERVVALLERRGRTYSAVSASRYAAGLHELVRRPEPAALVDILLVGAVIEARSCERFYSLRPLLESVDPELAEFYGSLLQSEARHFEDYLALARGLVAPDLTDRLDRFLSRDAELIQSPDTQLRFHSGVPADPER